MARESSYVDDSGFGRHFWLKAAGIVFGAAIAGMVIILIFSKVIYAFGFFGAFFLLAAALLLFGWLYDRRQEQIARSYEDAG